MTCKRAILQVDKVEDHIEGLGEPVTVSRWWPGFPKASLLPSMPSAGKKPYVVACSYLSQTTGWCAIHGTGLDPERDN